MLQNTIYKIYTAIIARGVSGWARSENIISPSQKGFLPYEGCLEHGFVLRSVLQDACRRKKPANVVWLDLKDAFGSAPHNILIEVLRMAGLRDTTIKAIKDIYDGSTTAIRTKSEVSPQIPCRRGVKQGCPLSPILFDLVVEVVIRAMEGVPRSGYQLANSTVKTLTYADDLCALATNQATTQRMLDKAQAAAKWAGLKFNPRKCATLTIHRDHSSRQRVDTFQPTLDGELIPALPWEGRYKYLGCKVGAGPKSELQQVGTEYLADCEAILKSGLADWQKLDAIHHFARLHLIYLLQNAEPAIGWARSLDKALRVLTKLHLKLPRRTISSFLYTPPRLGGPGPTKHRG